MQITFLELYHSFEDGSGIWRAQDTLLYHWQRALQLRQVPFIPKAKISFKIYAFKDYPNQERLKKEIQTSYGHRLGRKKDAPLVYRWCGNEYKDYDEFILKLSEQKQLMELIIDTEDL